MSYEYSSYLSVADFPQILEELPWINFVTTKWFQSDLYWVFLDPCNWNFWGWWGLSGRQKRWCHFRSDIPGSGFKDYLLKIDSSLCPLQIQISLLQRFRRPYFTTATQKKTKLKKNNIISSTRHNIILRSEFHGFWHQATTLLIEQRMETKA